MIYYQENHQIFGKHEFWKYFIHYSFCFRINNVTLIYSGKLKLKWNIIALKWNLDTTMHL